MGGNALKNTFTRRYQKDEYFALANEIQENLLDAFGKTFRATVIPAYRNKESFGDMDILYCQNGWNDIDSSGLSVDQVKETFRPNEVIKNGEVISFDYKELQIDLIFTQDRVFNYALSYFSFNDCGNLVGKLAHKFGLKHGHRGLTLPLRDGFNCFDEVFITSNHDETLEFLDLDPKVFNSGFDSLEDIFAFVSLSKYYHPELYKLENLNTIARVRDRKRDTYRKFLEFGKTQEHRVNFFENSNKQLLLRQIFERWPRAQGDFEAALSRLALQQLARTKFNGEIVSLHTGLSGKELGMFVKHLKEKHFANQAITAYYSSDTVIEIIKTEFERKSW